MNDPPEVGRLPRFARDITRLRTGVQEAHHAIDHCVLRPFSGVLEVSLGRGRVPTLDLSYLTLEPLVARAIAGSAGSRSRSSTGNVGPPDRQLTERGTDSDRSGDGPDEDRPEPRVRDVVHDQRPTQGEGAGHPAGTPDADGSTLTRLDLNSGQHPAHNRSTDTPGVPTQHRGAAGADERRVELGPTTRSEPTRRTLDRGPGETASPGEPGGPEAGGTTPGAEPSDWSGSTRPGSSPEAPDRLADPTAPDRTLIDRSGPTPEAGDGADGRSTLPERELPRATPPGVEPPQMVARRQGAEPGQDDASTLGRRRSGPAAEAADAVTGPDRESGARQGGSTGASALGAAGPSAGPSSPRMVVDQGEASADGDGWATASEPAGSAGDGAPDAARGPNSLSTDRETNLDAIIDAPTDPDSRLVDRLYRALQEREAIERRRRGDR